MPAWHLADVIYDNALACEKDVSEFVMEGQAAVSFPMGRLRLENKLPPELGSPANYVYWLDRDFPADISISWDFLPIREPGLCMLLVAATGRQGQDIFDPGLARRTGEYDQYNRGEIDMLHVSYFRRKAPAERAFHVCNLRKSYGFHLVAQGADPLPSTAEAAGPYRMQFVKYGPHVEFFINDLQILSWTDDGLTHGPVRGGGKVGFRQMAPMLAEYANLKVHRVENGGS